MMFKGTDWHPAKAKVVSKAAASERVRVIVLLHERAPRQPMRRVGVLCLDAYIDSNAQVLSFSWALQRLWGRFLTNKIQMRTIKLLFLTIKLYFLEIFVKVSFAN